MVLFFISTIKAGLTLLYNQAHNYIRKYDIIDTSASFLSFACRPCKLHKPIFMVLFLSQHRFTLYLLCWLYVNIVFSRLELASWSWLISPNHYYTVLIQSIQWSQVTGPFALTKSHRHHLNTKNLQSQWFLGDFCLLIVLTPS